MKYENGHCPRTLSGDHAWNKDDPRTCVACNVIDDSPQILVYREKVGDRVLIVKRDQGQSWRDWVPGEVLEHTYIMPLSGEIIGPKPEEPKA